MKTVCAIYGYEFTKEFSYREMRFVPLHSWVDDVHDKARDRTSYQLTGVVVAENYDADQIFRLEAVLSFIEQLDVLISDPREVEEGDFFNSFPTVARVSRRNDGAGAVLMQDTFFPDMRSGFIQLAMDQLTDEVFCQNTGWRSMFFKATEHFRLRKSFLDVSYFMLFSGLETFVRRTMKSSKNEEIAKVISTCLSELGFNIFTYDKSNLKRSADSYARLRHALFHDSAWQTTRKADDGSVIVYNLVDYYANFLILVNLVVLKGAGFDHPDFHWDTWITFQR